MRLLLCTLLFCVVAPSQGRKLAEAGEGIDPRPDVILIMADDVGVEAFPSYGGESYRTPHIDALAAEGTRFLHCYSQPLCTPSRVKIMTGRSNIRNYESFGILPRSEDTFAHALQRAGYRTCVVGKWQLFGSRRERLPKGAGTSPEGAGFDEHLLWQVDRIGSRYGDPLLTKNGEYLDDTAGGYGPDRFADHAVDFIQRQRAAARPYLLYFPMALVHSPFESPPGAEQTPKGKAGRQQRFAQMMRKMDAIVGRLVQAVDDSGGKERTLIVFTSDNGTARTIVSRQNGRDKKGGKGLSNARGTHVPLIARWPETVPAGRTDASLIDFCDFHATLCELASARPIDERELDGRSFAAQLRGQPGTPRDWLFCYCNPRPERAGFARSRCVRSKTHKLYGDGRFYDLTADPEELQPLPEMTGDPLTEAARHALTAALATMPEHPERIPEEHRQP